MRFHIVSLPNTSTTRDYSWSPYTQKVRNWSKMLTDLKHEVIIYGGPFNDAPCFHHSVCITETQQRLFERFPSFDPNKEPRQTFIHNVIANMHNWIQPDDVICLTEGIAQQPIIDHFSDHIAIEIGVGYSATITNRRAFESFSWMHYVYGLRNEQPNFLDAVIPNAYDPDDFPLGDHLDDYLVYVGRLDVRKGIEVAIDVAVASDRRLIVCGEGEYELPISDYVHHVGSVGYAERAAIVGNAAALIAPTLTVEPFGGAVVEAQLCGTPVITTDWGAFSETVDDCSSGYRCRFLSDYVDAVGNLQLLQDPVDIQNNAVEKWGLQSVSLDWYYYLRRTLPQFQGVVPLYPPQSTQEPPNRPPE